MSESSEYPSIYHPDIGEYIEIRNELAFKAARVLWDAIAAIYEKNVVVLPVTFTDKAPIVDVREENLARSTIPSDELKKAKKKIDGRVNNSGGPHIKWSDEEMFVIQDLPGWRDAVAAYQKAFPESKRTKNSVEQQWKKVAAGTIKKRQKSTENVESVAGVPEVPKYDPLKKGQLVKYTGTINSPYYRHIGTVERVPPNGDVLVRFDNGMEWLSRKYLEAQ